MSFEIILKYSNYFSGALLIGAEVYHVADREWMFYQSLQSFIFLQYIIVILGLGVHWGENLFRKIHQVALFFGIFAGIGAIVLTGWEVNQCFFDLSSTNVHQANECIDKYKSYAQLDGPHGITNTCASLSSNTASPLGGVCPNIKYGSTGGQALVGIQVFFVVYLMVVNIMELAKGYNNIIKDPYDLTSKISFGADNHDTMDKKSLELAPPNNTTPPKSGPTKRPLSVYYQKRY